MEGTASNPHNLELRSGVEGRGRCYRDPIKRRITPREGSLQSKGPEGGGKKPEKGGNRESHPAGWLKWGTPLLSRLKNYPNSAWTMKLCRPSGISRGEKNPIWEQGTNSPLALV